MDQPRIISVEWGRLEGQRPRSVGRNARLGEHGITVAVPIARLTTDDGSAGFGVCEAGVEQASAVLGAPLAELFSLESGAAPTALTFEYPLWDLAGQRAGLPVYALLSRNGGVPPQKPFRVPCYDTSLYFDDLHLASDQEAADLLAAEALEGAARGHRAFKIKIGRGARHMPLEEGTRRDIAVVRAVHEAVGPDVPLMIDANNGYNLNLAKRVLAETADCNIAWLEEAFHEDRVLYLDLREWLQERDLSVLIADGEGQADPRLLDWARQGVIDVIQYDVLSYGFTRWLNTGRELDAWGVRSAPHHYGSCYGNYAACHLAGAIQRLMFIEWDEATTPGLDTSGYHIEAGQVTVPDLPGFGLHLDEAVFQRAVVANGFRSSLK
jgi:L-alanine-DL-glutamate epimerase-like enolase superfamily enzyme